MLRRVDNPPNPWRASHVAYLGPAPPQPVEVFEERARSVLSENESPDLPFRYTLNPYRGCVHACAYCYARRFHEYLDFGAGSDFDRKIVVKTNAPEVLRRELARRSFARDWIVFSGVTDAYQALETRYELTRRCLRHCLDARVPVCVITKSSLVERDIDLLAALAEGPGAAFYASLAFDDEATARALEPFAPSPSQRLATLARVAAAGVPCGLALAPVIPGLNEAAIPALLAHAAGAGATCAFLTLLRLAGPVLPVFERRLREALPLRADRVLAATADARGGALGEARFHHRFVGRGPRWRAIDDLFRLHARRNGLRVEREALAGAKRTALPEQGELFGTRRPPPGAGAPDR